MTKEDYSFLSKLSFIFSSNDAQLGSRSKTPQRLFFHVHWCFPCCKSHWTFSTLQRNWPNGPTPSFLNLLSSLLFSCYISGFSSSTWPPNMAVPQEFIINPLLQLSSQKHLIQCMSLNIIYRIRLSNIDLLPKSLLCTPNTSIYPNCLLDIQLPSYTWCIERRMFPALTASHMMCTLKGVFSPDFITLLNENSIHIPAQALHLSHSWFLSITHLKDL